MSSTYTFNYTSQPGLTDVQAQCYSDIGCTMAVGSPIALAQVGDTGGYTVTVAGADMPTSANYAIVGSATTGRYTAGQPVVADNTGGGGAPINPAEFIRNNTTNNGTIPIPQTPGPTMYEYVND